MELKYKYSDCIDINDEIISVYEDLKEWYSNLTECNDDIILDEASDIAARYRFNIDDSLSYVKDFLYIINTPFASYIKVDKPQYRRGIRA